MRRIFNFNKSVAAADRFDAVPDTERIIGVHQNHLAIKEKDWWRVVQLRKNG